MGAVRALAGGRAGERLAAAVHLHPPALPRPSWQLLASLTSQLPTSTADLLTALLELLSSVAAYTVQNGSTPRKLAALFSSFIFGLPDDLGFEETYALFLRYTHATEHLLLAFIRDQKEAAAGTSIAKKLEDFISSASLSWLRRRLCFASRAARSWPIDCGDS